jgi:alcohol dehydrogenase class IV
VRLEFCTAPRIELERGALARVGSVAASLGRRAALVRGGRSVETSGALERLEASLRAFDVAVVAREAFAGEPEVAAIDAAAERVRAARADLVVGIGGGSALDAAKAVAGLIANAGSCLDYLEVVGAAKPLGSPAAPLVAIPTTAGTGTEVTRNAVITHRTGSAKASMRSPHLVPRVALLDPALTDSMSPEVTASTGLDALAQLVEPYVSSRAQPLTDALALEGVRAVAWALPRAWRDGADAEARDAMAFAALLGGMCLANAGLGAVHGFAAPLGASHPVPHGMACAALLAPVWEANVQALRASSSGGRALVRFAKVGEALLGSPRQHSGTCLAGRSMWSMSHLVLPRWGA